MRFPKFAALAALLALAAPLGGSRAAEIQPAVAPGGDIPADFKRPYVPPAARAPQFPSAFPRGGALYERRQAMIRMRDGARLFTVLVIPRGTRKAPIVLDRTPYSARKATERGTGPYPESILSPMYAELVRSGYIVAVQDVRGKYGSEGDRKSVV